MATTLKRAKLQTVFSNTNVEGMLQHHFVDPRRRGKFKQQGHITVLSCMGAQDILTKHTQHLSA
jgi:hypothetical protein